MSIDVLIVGGGPVGMTLGAELARYGVSVRIVHRTSQEIRQEPNRTKPVFLWSRTLELLDRSGSAAELVAAGQKLTGGNIVAEGKSIGHIDFTAVNSPHGFLLTLPQDVTERFLEQHLNRLGVQVERGSSFISLSHGGGALNWTTGLKAVIGRPDGGHEIVEAKWLVGCDGIQSGVRKYMEMPLQGGSRQSDWAMADVHLSGIGLNPSEFAIFWHHEGVLAIFPIQQGAYRIIADLGKGPGLWPKDLSLEEIQAVLDKRGPGGLTVSDPLWISGFRASDKKVRNYQMGRVFLSGDAAYAYSPMGGQGLNMGMQDAINLAWKLALVVKGICPEERLLPSYNVERSAANGELTGTISRLSAAANGRNQPTQMIRNLLGGALLGLLPTRRSLADSLVEISAGYAHSPLNGPEERAFPGPGPGDRMPPVAGEVPVGADNGPRFALYADASPEINEILRVHADLLEPNLRAPLSPRCVWLVRPDGYVAAVSLDLDVKLIADYLSDLKEA
jgi:2-polyprenyl-6-methoxyphenol hydroxylase-like FAD-dependent oxidoreductase